MAIELSESAHVDTFSRDNLPPAEQWPDMVFTLPELAYPARLNCATELLDRTIERVGADRRCLVTDGGTWSYGDLLARANRMAHVLVDDFGLVPGNRVLLRAPNNAELVAWWFAVLKAGGVVVATMPLLRQTELRPIIDKSLPTVAVCDDRLLDELNAAAGPASMPVLSGSDLDTRAAAKPATFDDVATAGDDVALIAFTSGTTGEPKGCMHFHRDVLAIADTFSAHLLQPTPDDLFGGSPPLAFTFGLGALVVFPLRAGAATLLLEQASPPLLLEGIARHRATIASTAPTAYRAMVRLLDGGDALSSLRIGVSAGETLPKSTWHAFRDATGVALVDGIGATEMLHIFISASGGAIRPGATGLPVPGYEAMVVDDDLRPVPDGEVGRLAVRGPTGCRYLADRRQTKYVRDGWNLTGDSYVRDGDGYFWFQARSDDMIISSGYNIAGPEVEEALLRHPDVAECAVVGVPDPERGSIVKAYVVLAGETPATTDTAAALQDFVKQQIAPYKYPRAVSFLDELPKTQTGKLQRFRLRELG